MDKYQTLREKDNPSNNVYPNIQSQNIPTGAVTAVKIANDAVTTAKINGQAVTTAKLANNAVSEDKIDNAAVTTAKLAASAVTTAKLDSSAVTTPKIADGAVTTPKIAGGAVTHAKLNLVTVNLKTYLTENNFDGTVHHLTELVEAFLDTHYVIRCYIYIPNDILKQLLVWTEISGDEVEFYPVSNLIDTDAKAATFYAGDAENIYFTYLG